MAEIYRLDYRVKIFALLCLLIEGVCFTCNNEIVNRNNARMKRLEENERINIARIEQRELCPDKPGNLETKVNISLRMKEIENNPSILENVLPGGTYIPPNCRSRERLAVLVPYRDREEHLKTFIPYMHAFLQRQHVHYTIFVAEMTQGTRFNTGLLQNVAFATADKTDNFTCFVVNDVDLLPTNENNFYRCADVPKHLCHSSPKYSSHQFQRYFGGSIALSREQFVKTNGFSNLYFGWGAQDDDILIRIELSGYKWTRNCADVGVYDALGHEQDKENPPNNNRWSLTSNAGVRMSYDGINSLKYKEVAFELRDLYTWVLVEVNKTEVTKYFTQYLPDMN